MDAAEISLSPAPARRIWGGRVVNLPTSLAGALNVVLSSLIILFPALDGGESGLTMLVGSAAYWLGVWLIHWRRPDTRTLGDCIYVAVGQVACAATALRTYSFIGL